MDMEFDVTYEAMVGKDGVMRFLGKQRTSELTFASREEVRDQSIAMVEEVLRRVLGGQRLKIIVRAYDL